ncbi:MULTISPECIES: amidase family protein [unclassified Burkholderia]|uniref:amidase family protein n=1 Tax=unclassified Burkholderia TaxID=2613784 RepID=UPI000F5B3EC8|nr:MULTISPECIES: amidase family protein [unclassified Burkholderia]RQR29366.1 amidase [Burkholderia sp. Bp9131]RQR74209.1 amidase [Burkholderia sp. Bp9015]RQR89587.1 amidase [Burkholderia sp. Bp8994]RQS17809.1 amidase [Burkholderia sp. Bp8995]RQS38132.1 amidase [Burkholderia sp. Bp8989]
MDPTDFRLGNVNEHACAERVRTCLAHADAHPGDIEAAWLARRDDAAVADARAWDAARRAGAIDAPLAGAVLTVKACFDCTGWVTHAGSRVLADEPPARIDAAPVSALRRAGAVLVAQTAMTEFAYGALGVNRAYGTPTTPLDARRERVAGGSSSGAAVSVALGAADLSLGSDTSGSARIPAAFCGVTGFKPSRGRYASDGMRFLSTSFDVPGLLAATVGLCRQADVALHGREARRRRPAAIRDLQFIVPEAFVADDVDPVVGRAFDAWLSRLSAHGARIRRKRLDCVAEAGAVARAGGIIAAEAFMLHRARLAAAADRYDQLVGPRIAAGEQVRAHDYAAALRRLAALAAAYHAELGDADAVLTPTVPMLPPRVADLADEAAYLAQNARAFRLTEFANRLDLPSISVPGDLRNRQPVGLLITGHRGEDARLLDVAAAVESALTAESA